jgi:hypothetical protein
MQIADSQAWITIHLFTEFTAKYLRVPGNWLQLA